MKEFKLPLSEPQVVGSHFIVLNELAQKLDSHNTEYALINLVFELSENANE